MKILGICNSETASACLMVDGEIICAASEERFTRIKLDSSFPINSIKFCLNYLNIDLQEIDVVAYSFAKGFHQDLIQKYVSLGANYGSDLSATNIILERIKWEIVRDKKKRLGFDLWVKKNINLSKQKVLDFYHHEAHAASASLVSPFDEGYVYTSDGRGDFEAVTIYHFQRNSKQQLRKIFSSTSIESFGFFYGRITGLLGFKPMRHEGKITGLAAYGEKEKGLPLCRKMMEVNEGKIIVHLGEYYRPFFTPYSDVLKSEVSGLSKEDFAAAAQFHLEKMMADLLEFHLKEQGVENINLMCAGGVFGNVKVTQRLKDLPSVNNVYVQPQMGDGGLCIGACALAYESLIGQNSNTKRYVKELSSIYLGPEAQYRDRSIESYCKEFECATYSTTGVAPKFIESLKNKKVLGLINGRMEFGPRALCNRSIIVGTSDRSINDWLNKRMKRTEFMPFSPVLRREVAEQCIVNYKSDDVTLNYMTSTINCTDEFQKRNPAVVHIDQTIRPQIVTESSNNFIWTILKLWENESTEMSLVNTSFNVHEEPIICDVDEGFSSLRSGVIDELWVVSGKKTCKFVCKS